MVKRILLSLAAGLLAAGIAAMGWNLAQVGQQREGLIQSVLRLHIVADSDDPQDQAVKLAVRDALVSEYGQTLSQAESLEQAQELAGRLLPQMLDTARQTAAAQGCTLPITGEVGELSFPAVSYEGYTLPAGEYQAVRIQLGEGEGHQLVLRALPGGVSGQQRGAGGGDEQPAKGDAHPPGGLRDPLRPAGWADGFVELGDGAVACFGPAALPPEERKAEKSQLFSAAGRKGFHLPGGPCP